MILIKNGQHLSRFFLLFFTTLCLVLANNLAMAAKITKVEGKKVYIDLEGVSASSGDRATVTDKMGKKRAILEIEKVKGNKAMARVTKGKVQKGWTVSNSAWREDSGSASGSSSRRSSKGIGLLLGYSMDQMKISFDTGESLSLGGTGTAVRVAFDMLPSKSWALRFALGQEQFSVTGTAPTAVCAGSTDCYLRISYTTLDFQLRKLFGSFWLGGGFSYFLKGDLQTTAIDRTSVKDVFVGSGEVGYDFKIGKQFILPLMAGIGIMPPSSSVTPMFISFKSGLIYLF